MEKLMEVLWMVFWTSFGRLMDVLLDVFWTYGEHWDVFVLRKHHTARTKGNSIIRNTLFDKLEKNIKIVKIGIF